MTPFCYDCGNHHEGECHGAETNAMMNQAFLDNYDNEVFGDCVCPECMYHGGCDNTNTEAID